MAPRKGRQRTPVCKLFLGRFGRNLATPLRYSPEAIADEQDFGVGREARMICNGSGFQAVQSTYVPFISR
jgi:hypothetical protein